MTTPPSPASPPLPAALLQQVDPLGRLPAATQAALAARLRTATLVAGQALRPACGGADALAFALDGELEWVGTSPGRAIPPARTAGARRAFLIRRMDEDGASPRVVRSVGEARVAWAALAEAVSLAAEHPPLAELLERLQRRDALACMHSVLGTLDDVLLDDLETAADWRSLRRGELLFAAGSQSDGIYFVVSGRLKAIVRDDSGRERVTTSIGPGEPAGEVAFFTGGVRTATVRAARATQVVQLTDAEFDLLAGRRPRLARAVARSAVERMETAGSRHLTTATVVLLPTGGAPVPGFAADLAGALAVFGPVQHLDRARAEAILGSGVSAPEGTAEGEHAAAWLEAAETAHRFLLLEADPEPSEWTQRCLRQADRVVLVADATRAGPPGPAESQLPPAEGAVEAPVSLVLVHPPATDLPCGTRRWLEARPWVSSHHHVRRGDPAPGGVARVARALADRSVGMVLGGGGARGFAHIGMLRALTEAGVPVDRIAGTSMGASMAAQWALGWSPRKMLQVNRRVWIEMRPHRVLTLPIISILSNRKGLVCGRLMYGDAELEDLWIPFFCVSSSLTRAAPVVHRRGSLLWACIASASLPGVAPPVLMDGELLVDGALLNNLPADVMHADGVGTLIAAEVSPECEAVYTTCQRVPVSGWDALRERWRGRPFPSIPEVMMRASMLHSIGRERDIAGVVDLFLRPPVDPFPMMDFEILDDVARVGYEYARDAVAQWLAPPPAPGGEAAQATRHSGGGVSERESTSWKRWM